MQMGLYTLCQTAGSDRFVFRKDLMRLPGIRSLKQRASWMNQDLWLMELRQFARLPSQRPLRS
jgi:hypothetical protein